LPIDLSNLTQQKRAFLKANPELLRSLEREIPNQIQRANTRKKKMIKGKSKLQRSLEDVDCRVAEAKHKADKLRRKYMMDPNLREINEKYQRRLQKSESASALVCPKCKGSDHGNKMNGRPWCMKCNTALNPANILEKWKKLPEIEFARNALKDELHRLNPGLNPRTDE